MQAVWNFSPYKNNGTDHLEPQYGFTKSLTSTMAVLLLTKAESV